MKVAVVTPTIASKHLKQCIDSVNKQTYKDITHYIFVDGCQYEPEARKILKQSPKTKMIELEENVGKGWYGHRVYAACSFLVNADVICYLDEDNWYEPNHIEELVNVIKEGNDWAYSLRKIYNNWLTCTFGSLDHFSSVLENDQMPGTSRGTVRSL